MCGIGTGGGKLPDLDTSKTYSMGQIQMLTTKIQMSIWYMSYLKSTRKGREGTDYEYERAKT